MNKKSILFSFLLLLSGTLLSQTWVQSELTTNAVLVQKYSQLKDAGQLRSGGSITDTLSLGTKGFLDDFSNEGPYPDTAKWLNNYVYINRDLPIAPITLGAATFDGINANGYPYNFGAGMYTSGKADTLTSKPINLYYPGDTSVYFSFYYQPQGRGNFPDPADSLILEFKSPTLLSNFWKHVWAKKGPGTNLSDSTWKLVMIKITDPDLLQNGFQFRFSNWATLSGNGDHWNIDYVYLNRGRNRGDTIPEDVAFVYNTPPLIDKYSAVPWKQYDSTLMKKSHYHTTIRNNNSISCFGEFEYRIYDENHVQVNSTYLGGGLVYNPYVSTGYVPDPACAFPELNYTIPSPLTGRTRYTIESVLDATTNDTIGSDTVRYTQIFDNYFAYDDGTAEVSFGLSGALHAQMAVKYTMTVGDTLRCIDIFFNPQWTDASLYTFKLRVWNASGSGGPGTSLFSSVDSLYHPIYNQTGPNRFTRYFLETPLYLPAGKTFFVGTEQNTTQLINIGVDKNTDSNDKTYYNMTGAWNHPPDPGSLMIHPVFGTAEEMVGIKEPVAEQNSMSIYPNPANERLFIRMSAISPSQKMTYSIIDIYGRTVVTGQSLASEPIDLTNIAAGVYFVRVTAGNVVSAQKFIRSK